jgi:hypothetical protein
MSRCPHQSSSLVHAKNSTAGCAQFATVIRDFSDGGKRHQNDTEGHRTGKVKSTDSERSAGSGAGAAKPQLTDPARVFGVRSPPDAP